MIDEAGNLLFDHNGNKYRIFNFNWRLQRDFLNKIVPLQVPSEDNDGSSATKLVGDDSAIAQDYIFSKTQIEIDSSFVFIDQSRADSIFDGYEDSLSLFQKILLEVTPFLSGGSESSHPKQKSGESHSRTINKPRGTSKT